jgi:hypothetical protein
VLRTEQRIVAKLVPAGQAAITPHNKATFWRPYVAEALDLSGLFQPEFRVTRSTAVATAGRCFAQHVGLALYNDGLSVLDVERAPLGLDAETAGSFGFNLYSGHYGDLYTAAQMRQLLQDSHDLTPRPIRLHPKHDRKLG